MFEITKIFHRICLKQWNNEKNLLIIPKFRIKSIENSEIIDLSASINEIFHQEEWMF